MKYPYGRYEPCYLFPDGENNLLDMMETISTQTKKSQLEFGSLLEKVEVKAVADFLSVSPRQAILFAVLANSTETP